MKKNLTYLISTSILAIALLYIFDQVMALNYMSKVGLKIALFSIFPAVYAIQTGENVLKSSILNLKRNRPHLRGLNKSATLGILIFIVLIVAYVFIRPYIDTGQMIVEFQEKYKINKSNLLYYSFYLVFINSFLEEFFFRGFLFLNIKKLGLRKTAYIFSSLLFAVYHIANFQNWFSIPVFILALIGLFAGGCIFNYLDDQQETFLNSWFVHICADLAIVLIGFYVFGMLGG
ncbi:MAG: CPBP family intramembrane metalloprotease [Clostridia bacterium]|nr:CPBP family intramembrane metalloprotease [Clostridia bacterium]